MVRLADATVDDWGVRFRVEILPARGFRPQEKEEFDAAACWDFFHMSNHAMWGCGWLIVTTPEAVRRAEAYAAEQQRKPHDLMQFVNELAFPKGYQVIWWGGHG